MRKLKKIIQGEQLTLFSEAFLNSPVKTCPKQGNKSGLQEQEADCGLKCSELSQSSDPVMLLLRTCVEQSISPSIPCTPVWSEKVTKSTLTSYRHLRLVRPTKEKDCSLSESGKMWPTPVKEDYRRRGPNSQQQGLPEIVHKLWPTPNVSDQYYGHQHDEGRTYLRWEALKLWPTPREFMYKDSVVDRGKGNIGEKVGGQLNPDWVGQLMGYPEGWTDLDVDEPREWAGWPALLGEEQYPFEFPRTTTGCKNRAKQLKAYGNSVVPQQAYPFFRAIAEIEKMIKREVIP